MKIALLTDLHLTIPGEKVSGIDPLERFDRALDAIHRYATESDLLVILGDLADNGEPEAYRLLQSRLKTFGVPTRLLLGNHDNREALLRIWPDLPTDGNGFLQSSISYNNMVLLFLDTNQIGEHAGGYCVSRQRWLADQLDAADQRSIYIFMHHPPFNVGMRIDASKVLQFPEFGSLIKRSGTVKQIFIGHIHRAAAGCWEGTSWASIHSTHKQVGLDFPYAERHFLTGPAQFGIVHLDESSCVLHFHDFLEPYARLSL